MTGWVIKKYGISNSKQTILEKREKYGQQKYWLCQCECGFLIGTRFGKLTVIEDGGLQFDDTSDCQRNTSLYQCDCGSESRFCFNNRLKKEILSLVDV